MSRTTLHGYVDTTPAPGRRRGTAVFDLLHSPTGTGPADTPKAVFACTAADPRIVDVLLREIQPGDLLSVTGTVVQPDDPAAPAHVSVDALEVLEAAQPAPYDLVLERYGIYAVVFDADRDAVPVFTANGTWVGEAASPDKIGDLIDAYESRGTR
jgi:hypothetical protein